MFSVVQIIRPAGDPAPRAYTQATRTAALAARQGRTTHFLRAPTVVAAAAAGTVGMATYIAVPPPGTEPGFHAGPDYPMPVLEGAMAVAVVSVAVVAAIELRRRRSD